MAPEIFDILKTNGIFSSLDDQTIRELVTHLEKVILHKGDMLFTQGDPSDSLFMLLSGKLIIVVAEKHREKIVGDVDPGETVGELGAISSEPRTASVQATEDSVVLKMSQADFRKICADHPSVIVEVMNSLARRSRGLIDLISKEKKPNRHIAILPANQQAQIVKFTDYLRFLTKDIPQIAILSDYDNALQERHASAIDLKKMIAELEKQKTTILYILSSHETTLTKVCFEKVEIIYVLANGDGQPKMDHFAVQTIKRKELIYRSKPELILLHEKKKRFPKHTKKWLKYADFGMHHHLRADHQADFERLLRFFRGVAVGVVLGGGGVRSWAHLGALKGICESNIPIDAIGGTSAGAIVGGFYALHETYEDPNDDLGRLSKATSDTLRFRNLTWPSVSLFDGKDFTLTQQSVFGKTRIENLWRPFFCVSCNLAKSAAVMHKSGLLWRRIRSSTAVPGVFPPVVLHGQIYLDGGIANNLPVDLMQKLSSGIGTIIAIELIHHVTDDKGYHFPSVLPFWKVVLAKMGWGYHKMRFPHFVDTFLKSLLVGSAVKQRENSLEADILIQPDLSGFHLLSISSEQQTQLFEIGYNAALNALKKNGWLKKLS